MTEISNELLANLVMEMNGKVNQRLAGIESFLLAMGQQIEKMAGDSRINEQKENFRVLEERLMLGIGTMLSQANEAKDNIEDLRAVEFNVTSPANEDGIIDWLVGRVAISEPRFIETGSGDFSHGKCRFLAARRNWTGMLFDSDGPSTYYARHNDFYRMHNLGIMEAHPTIENIDDLINTNECGGRLGLLSLSNGGTEYWVWEALTAAAPDLVAIGFNPVFGDRYAVTVPYNAHFTARDAHPTGYYHGASIAALKGLATEKGYEFLGTNSKGTTAFFVRADSAASVLSAIKHKRAFPARARNAADGFEELASVGGISRLKLIGALPVINVTNGKRLALETLDQPYSEEWQRGMA
jgi:hypothetical protein